MPRSTSNLPPPTTPGLKALYRLLVSFLRIPFMFLSFRSTPLRAQSSELAMRVNELADDLENQRAG